MNISRETKHFHDLVQYPKYRFFDFPSLSMFLECSQILGILQYHVLIRSKCKCKKKKMHNRTRQKKKLHVENAGYKNDVWWTADVQPDDHQVSTASGIFIMTNKSCCRSSFFQRIVPEWNILAHRVRCAHSVETFRAQLAQEIDSAALISRSH